MAKIRIASDNNFRAKTRGLIQQCDEILTAFYGQGIQISLRKLYYELVSRLIIENKDTEYNNLSKTITKARMAGLIDWDHICDETREVYQAQYFQSPKDLLQCAAKSYRVDRWAGQNIRVEVWSEKSALTSILQPICEEYDVRYLATRGHPSVTAKYEMRERIIDNAGEGLRQTVILYFGDHDPTGMTIPKAMMEMFFDLRVEYFNRDLLKIERLALDIDQVAALNLPPNPTKQTDPNYKAYAREYGEECWEIDAMPYNLLQNLLKKRLEELIDQEAWGKTFQWQEEGRSFLANLSNESV